MGSAGGFQNLMSAQSNPTSVVANGNAAAMGSLNKAVANQQQTTAGTLAGLHTQLMQNLGTTQQGVVNRGLGNTSVANTLAQAPQATYNQGVLNANSQGSQNMAELYAQMAGAQMGGANNLFSAYLNNMNGQANAGATNAATIGQQSQNAKQAMPAYGFGGLPPASGI